jgi:hypothetical protein
MTRARYKELILLCAVICVVSCSYGFMDWVGYWQSFHAHPEAWYLYLHGGIDAPLQYRVGTWLIVAWAHTRLHLSIWLTLTLIDVVSLGLALGFLVYVLGTNVTFLAYPASSRILSMVGLFFGVEYYLAWGHWFQYSDTMPSFLFVCLSLVLISGKSIRNRYLSSVFLVGAGCLQGLVRADVAVVLNAGFFVATCSPLTTNIPFGRKWQLTTSALAGLGAGLVQLYLMKVIFPTARYGSAGVFRFGANFSPDNWMTAALALLPFWAILYLTVKKKYRLDDLTAMLLLSSCLYFVLWLLVGRLQEVRIFLPFAMALLPSTVLATTGMLATGEVDSPDFESSIAEPFVIADHHAAYVASAFDHL